MNRIFALGFLALSLSWSSAGEKSKPVSIFDGKSFAGWEGDTQKTWRIAEGAIVGGTLEEKVPRNEFVATARRYTNFVLRLKFKIVGTEGFVNGGVQIRSERIASPPNEMKGYQADIGDGWWGALYDESRRNKVLAKPEAGVVEKVLQRNDWNDYEIRCEGKRIRLAINSQPTVDYTEPDDSLPQFGLIGLQVHGGGKTVISYKDITIEELP